MSRSYADGPDERQFVSAPCCGIRTAFARVLNVEIIYTMQPDPPTRLISSQQFVLLTTTTDNSTTVELCSFSSLVVSNSG